MQNRFAKTALFLSALTAPLGLAACADQGPWPMPTGYTYENGRYQAPPGPQPVVKQVLEVPYAPAPAAPVSTMTTSTTTMTASNSEAVGTAGNAAGTIVDHLFGQFGKPAEPVWIQPAQGAARSAAFETQLRAALTDRNVQVSDTAGGGPFGIRYDVAAGDGGASHVTLSLTSGGMKAAEASGDVDLGDGAAASHVETHSVQSMTTTSSAADIPAGPSAVPAIMPAPAGKPEPLAPMHLND